MFSTKEAAAFILADNKYLSSGIVDDITISEVKYEKSPNGNKYISVTLSKDEATVNMTIWESKKFSSQETDAYLQKKCYTVMGRLQQIVKAYYPVNDPATECEVATFDDLANWFINAINNRDKSKLVRIKIVYDNKGFLSLPTYAKYTFIEPMAKPANWA